MTAALIKADLGADAGSPISQPSSFGDPAAQDCFWISGEVSITIQATTRADQDMPADAYNFQGGGNVAEVPGATRGWVKLTGDPEGSATVTSSVIVVKGQNGLNIGVQVTNHPYDVHKLAHFAADIATHLG